MALAFPMIGSGGGPGGYGSDWELFHLDAATRPVRATARENPAIVGSRRGEGEDMMMEGRRGPAERVRIHDLAIYLWCVGVGKVPSNVLMI